MSQKISTILFDADGVLQYPAVEYELAFSKILGSRIPEANQFFADIFLIERASLDGKGDFRKDLIGLLNRWDLLPDPDEVLNISTQIKPNESMLSTISALRASGFLCCLASNQQSYRAHFMSEILGYSRYFDKEFYSCNLGFIKPDVRYFESILTNIGNPPSAILFIDDQESNVIAARSLGLNGAVFSATFENSDQALNDILSEYGILVQNRA
jgi:putative hydrolase of the HAD superfamily